MTLSHDLKRIRELMRPVSLTYGTGVASLFLVNLADATAPVMMAVAIDLTEAALTQTPARTPQLLELLGLQSSSFSLVGAVGAYLGLLVLANISRYPMLMNTAVPSHRVGQTLRRTLTKRLLSQSQPYYDKAKSGDLMSLATADIQAIRMMLGPGILISIDTVFLVGLVLAVMFSMSWSLTLVALLPLPLIALITNKLSHAEFKRFKRVQDDLSTLTERTRESYAGVRVIQGYAQEDYDHARFERASLRHYSKNMGLAKVNALFEPSLNWMMGISIVLVFVVGGIQVIQQSVTLGTFVAFIFLVNYLSGPMVGFGWAVSLMQRGRASLERFDAFMAKPLLIQDAPDATSPTIHGALEIRDLTFSYGGSETEPAEPALKDINMSVEAGQTLGIIGAVGSGKSTLVKLLVRLYEPPSGTVFVDGHDVRGVELAHLRKNIVLAPQESFLFSDTVTRNILLAGDFERDETLYTKQAHLHDELLMLKKGYDTVLGERGVNLSGGQRQRLAIARAVAANPQLLILDDCLSAVDARTEEAILNQLDEVFAGRTGIVVSHRVRAVQRCDHIVVLDEGRIAEQGSHDALMDLNGQYARIALAQTTDSTPPEAQPSTLSHSTEQR